MSPMALNRHDWNGKGQHDQGRWGRGSAMKLILMGDVNLMDVTNPAEPFRKILGELHAADVVFGNLECCLHLPASRHSDANEGFFADPVVGGEALKLACIHAVGIANNVNYGATSIAASIARLDEVGILHTGAGPNLTAARAPAAVDSNGLRVGGLQRSSVYYETEVVKIFPAQCTNCSWCRRPTSLMYRSSATVF